jgi:hypothetical protein
VARSLVLGTIKVTLGPKATFAVTKSGKAVKSLRTGIYNVTIIDRSAKHDVSIRKIGGLPTGLTGKAFRGTRTLKLDLSTGQWKLYSVAAEQAIFSFVRVKK